MGQTREADPEQLYLSCCSIGVFCEFVPDLPRLFFHSWLPQNIWGGADALRQGVCPCFNPSERERERERESPGERKKEREREREPQPSNDTKASGSPRVSTECSEAVSRRLLLSLSFSGKIPARRPCLSAQKLFLITYRHAYVFKLSLKALSSLQLR